MIDDDVPDFFITCQPGMTNNAFDCDYDCDWRNVAQSEGFVRAGNP
jgi:hypothetical protein